MPHQNIFDDLRKDGKVNVNRVRRVAHSASDSARVGFQNFTNRVSTVFARGSSAKERGVAVMDVSLQVLDTSATLLTHTGTAAAAAVIAVSAISGVAFVAAISGPQAALAMGLLGLVIAVRAAYSDRDSAHDALRKYTWSFLTSTPPEKLDTEDKLEAAAEAAFTLMEDGKAQMSRLHEKFQVRAKAFNEFNKSFIDKSQALADARGAYRIAQTNLNTATAEKTATAGLKGPLGEHRIRIALEKFNAAHIKHTQATNNFNNLKKELDKMWAGAIVSGGAIFEFSRRCIHASNYIQAAEIVHLRSYFKFRKSHAPVDLNTHPSHFTGPTLDFYDGINTVTGYRDAVTAADAAYATILENAAAGIDATAYTYTPPSLPGQVKGVNVGTP